MAPGEATAAGAFEDARLHERPCGARRLNGRSGDHRIERPDRLRGRAHFAASGWTSSASTTTCGRCSSAPRRRPTGTGRGSSVRSARRYRHHTVDIRDRERSCELFARATADRRARHPRRRAALARLGGARAVHRLRHQRGRHAERARGDARRTLPEAAVHLHLDEQGVRRPAELAAARRARDALGDRPRRTPTRTGSARTCPSIARLHSVFGASKVAADVLVQEYGRYFGMRRPASAAGR